MMNSYTHIQKHSKIISTRVIIVCMCAVERMRVHASVSALLQAKILAHILASIHSLALACAL